jgi:hypothetical protein
MWATFEKLALKNMFFGCATALLMYGDPCVTVTEPYISPCMCVQYRAVYPTKHLEPGGIVYLRAASKAGVYPGGRYQ